MEVYKGTVEDQNQGNEDGDEGIPEFDLEEETTQEASRLLAIAVFFSRKSFSANFLFSDMLKAWNMKQLAAVEKIGDYIFRLKFITEAEKNRVLDSGPWCHKGHALIVVHYNGLVQSSEIKITSLYMWVRFYDLPPAMMKDVVAMQLGGQLGKVIKANHQYLGYMRMRVKYPLEKPLMLQLMIKIKGWGLMLITLRYKNVPHFCYSCRRMGHAAMSCDDHTKEEQGVKYGEELRASPSKRVKEISIWQTDSRMARALFQVVGLTGGRPM
jgi:hypothetical protein